MERNEVMIHATTWMNIENIMLSERSQTKGHILDDSIYMNIQNRQIHRQSPEWWLACVEGGNAERPLIRYGVSFWDDEAVYKLDRGSGCTIL